MPIEDNEIPSDIYLYLTIGIETRNFGKIQGHFYTFLINNKGQIEGLRESAFNPIMWSEDKFKAVEEIKQVLLLVN
jgi:hypothetical protein